ncbi:MAG: DEAD/DEAH box helicase [Helicobacteraceae bacterium]|nr:DEAD/DEAH box helicase [Helicobacteraceae bacterium]
MAKQLPQAAHTAARLFSFVKSGVKSVGGAVVSGDKAAAFSAEPLKILGINVFVLPDIKACVGEDLRSYQEELLSLCETLGDFYRAGEKGFLIVPAATASKFLPAPTLFKSFELRFGDTIDIKSLLSTLLNWGYSAADMVEQKGEMSVRGEVIDIYSNAYAHPVRVLLDGDQIESLRFFDIATQKSEKEEIESALIRPALFAMDASLQERMRRLIEDDPSESFIKDMASLGLWKLRDLGLGVNILENRNFIAAEDVGEELDEIYRGDQSGLVTRSFFDALLTLTGEGEFKPIAVDSPKRLIEFHKEKAITITYLYDAQLKAAAIEPKAGIELLRVDSSASLIGSRELIISLNKPQKARRQRRARLMLDSLCVGDLVVHEQYGVGRFEAIEQVNIMGGVQDFIAIGYCGGERLLLPVENLCLIDRFVAESGVLPTLDRLGKGGFMRIKEGVKRKLYEIANEIIKRAALREAGEAYVIEADSEAIERFQNSAGFDYTEDQMRSIGEIFADLSSGKAMDRLLCGDVGFGKTEVAMNAILAAVRAGFQAALIVPTTLLSHQHFANLRERFEPFDLIVRRLDRFASSSEKAAVKRGLKEGSIGVVVGTHALLACEFKHLALMIIDEEQRFGVKQKEALKDKSKNLHILSMSATPIPRSLNMALSGIKSISRIETPPIDLLGVRSYVREFDEKEVKEAVLREKRRGGQVFYLFNRIAGIEAKRRFLERILPGVKILVLHSQISGDITEAELLRFERGEYDLLLSTTIIESGIHMPNVNTIIIDGADRFGIADLHQLRGRVGRSRRQGYCYFVVEDKEALTDEAKRRLIALESNAMLGSGANLAFHDLEIRGGGNILGADQSGHIKQIGYSLYLKMLEEALDELKAAPKERKNSVELRLGIKAFISRDCVAEERLRLELYRRFSQVKSAAEVYELEAEMEDRFGAIDASTRSFIELMEIKTLAENSGVTAVRSFSTDIALCFEDGREAALTSPSKDDDDIIKTTLEYLKTLQRREFVPDI